MRTENGITAMAEKRAPACRDRRCVRDRERKRNRVHEPSADAVARSAVNSFISEQDPINCIIPISPYAHGRGMHLYHGTRTYHNKL